MLALYRDGRQADALARYRDGRQRLAGDLGIEPGAELRALEQSILRHDAALAPPATSETFAANGGAPGDSPRRARRRRMGLAAALAAVFVAGAATIAAVAPSKAPHTAGPIRGDAVAVVDAARARLVGSVPVGSPPSRRSRSGGDRLRSQSGSALSGSRTRWTAPSSRSIRPPRR